METRTSEAPFPSGPAQPLPVSPSEVPTAPGVPVAPSKPTKETGGTGPHGTCPPDPRNGMNRWVYPLDQKKVQDDNGKVALVEISASGGAYVRDDNGALRRLKPKMTAEAQAQFMASKRGQKVKAGKSPKAPKPFKRILTKAERKAEKERLRRLEQKTTLVYKTAAVGKTEAMSDLVQGPDETEAEFLARVQNKINPAQS